MRRSPYNISNDNHDNFGITSANSLLKMANIGNRTKLDPALPLSLTLQPKISSSNLTKKYAINLIKFCLKTGITENKKIIKLLEENEIVLKGRTFDRYKSMAEKLIENDVHAAIWLSDKVQNALIHDYKDICDRYDRQLVLDDILMGGLIKQAVDVATERDRDPEKYFRYLDIGELMKIQAMSNFTMKNKLESISKGFITYNIKRYIDHLREKQRENTNMPKDSDDKRKGFVLAPHLQEIEKRLGKRLSDLEEREGD